MNPSGNCGNGGSTMEGEEQDDPSSSPPLLNESNALKNFRNEWKRELDSSPQHVTKPIESCDKDTIAHNTEDKARVLFQMGVENEEKGKLYEAIQYYRRAFQLVPDIEFRMSQQQVHSRSDGVKGEVVSEDEEVDGNELSETDTSEEGQDKEEVPYDPSNIDLFTHLHYVMQKHYVRSICTPLLTTNSTHISALPTEIFLYILRWVVSSDLDLRSFEMCARVSRGFYVCCRDPEIWRAACSRVWGMKCGSLASGGYKTWREMFICRPKLQYSGCYISKTTYIRPGENSFQDAFYRPWHLVQYYRYLRFFPDGRVLMLTTVEDPSGSVGLLRGRTPLVHNPPICIGYYRLHDNTVSLVVTPDNKQRTSRPNSNSSHNHTFHLELEIVSHRNRMNGKLIWHGYSVFSKRNGIESNTTFDLDAARYPPFWYSRVKSYTAESTQPLV